MDTPSADAILPKLAPDVRSFKICSFCCWVTLSLHSRRRIGCCLLAISEGEWGFEPLWRKKNDAIRVNDVRNTCIYCAEFFEMSAHYLNHVVSIVSPAIVKYLLWSLSSCTPRQSILSSPVPPASGSFSCLVLHCRGSSFPRILRYVSAIQSICILHAYARNSRLQI